MSSATSPRYLAGEIGLCGDLLGRSTRRPVVVIQGRVTNSCHPFSLLDNDDASRTPALASHPNPDSLVGYGALDRRLFLAQQAPPTTASGLDFAHGSPPASPALSTTTIGDVTVEHFVPADGLRGRWAQGEGEGKKSAGRLEDQDRQAAMASSMLMDLRVEKRDALALITTPNLSTSHVLRRWTQAASRFRRRFSRWRRTPSSAGLASSPISLLRPEKQRRRAHTTRCTPALSRPKRSQSRSGTATRSTTRPIKLKMDADDQFEREGSVEKEEETADQDDGGEGQGRGRGAQHLEEEERQCRAAIVAR
uniref:Uncharacterized protein n=1 Tax=Mycena chlorophos TaxID=658473 RepID=A0ABQ0KW72_MYCCL|nr:predicted protein [Mycena chlorophos]